MGLRLIINFKDGTQEYPIGKLSGFSQMFDDLFEDITLSGNIIAIPFNCKLFNNYLDFDDKIIVNLDSNEIIYDMLLLEKYLCVYNYKINVDFILKYWKNIDGKIMKSIIRQWDMRFIEELFSAKFDFGFIRDNVSSVYDKIIYGYDDICNVPLVIYQKIGGPLLGHITYNLNIYGLDKLNQCKKWFDKYKKFKYNKPCFVTNIEDILSYNDPLVIILILRWQNDIHLLDKPDIISAIMSKTDSSLFS